MPPLFSLSNCYKLSLSERLQVIRLQNSQIEAKEAFKEPITYRGTISLDSD